MARSSPVEAAVARALRDAAVCGAVVESAERSPLGPRALRIRAGGGDGAASRHADLAGAIRSLPFVEAVAERSPNVYVRCSLDLMRSVLVDAYATNGAVHGCEGRGQLLAVAFADRTCARTPSALREAFAGRAIASLLAAQGYGVIAVPGAASGAVMVDPLAHGGIERAAAPLRAAVGGADVCQGPLRARYGGAVLAEDLLAELSESQLALAFLSRDLPSRVQLDDPWIASARTSHDAIVSAAAAIAPRTGTETGPSGTTDAGAAAVYALAAELDRLGPAAAQAASSLEPALVARALHALASAAQRAAGKLAAADPLRTVAVRAVASAWGLIGLEHAVHVPSQGEPYDDIFGTTVIAPRGVCMDG